MVESPGYEDLGPGEGDLTEGKPMPMLKIEWGSPSQAKRIIDLSGMVLVVLDRQTAIRKQVKLVAGRWVATPFTMNESDFSNSLRVVTAVRAFQDAVQAAKPNPGELLAVLMPLNLERQIHSAQQSVANGAGLLLDEISSFHGRFDMGYSGLRFKIIDYERRRTR